MGLKILIGIGVFLAVAIAIAILIGRFLKKVEEDVEQWEEPLHREFPEAGTWTMQRRCRCNGRPWTIHHTIQGSNKFGHWRCGHWLIRTLHLQWTLQSGQCKCNWTMVSTLIVGHWLLSCTMTTVHWFLHCPEWTLSYEPIGWSTSLGLQLWTRV